MTLELPTWIGGNGANQYSARLDRRIIDLVFTEGVIDPGSGGLEVTERGAGANNSVDVAAGSVIVGGDDQADQGKYLCKSTATENVALSSAPGTNARIDLIVAQVRDSEAGGPAGDDWIIDVVEGAVAASPSAPATPDSAVALAEVLRTNGDTSITDSMITDVRPTSAVETFTTLSNFLSVADTTARDALSPDEGDVVWVEDINEAQVYDGTSWLTFAPVALDVQEFTSSGTWNKPSTGTVAVVTLVGGGGGGAGGGTNRTNGACGGGGGLVHEAVVFQLSDLGATESVTIGAGGAGYTASTPTQGDAGGDGGNTSFGAHLTAWGGAGGDLNDAGGGAGLFGAAEPAGSNGNGGYPQNDFDSASDSHYIGGGNGGTQSNPGGHGTGSGWGGGGGGGGGGSTNGTGGDGGNSARSAGGGGGGGSYGGSNFTGGNGGAGRAELQDETGAIVRGSGAAGGGQGVNGSDGGFLEGGGGGGGENNAQAGHGGAGGIGAGGGGGGGENNSGTPGQGGDGGDGYALVVVY